MFDDCGSNYSSGLPVMRTTIESNKICPFNQWYCHPTCVLATSEINEAGVKQWYCSFNNAKNNSKYVRKIETEGGN